MGLYQQIVSAYILLSFLQDSEDIAEGDKLDVDLEVKAAREAFDHGIWPRISGFERGKLMNKFADLVEEHIEELAVLDSLDGGKQLKLGKTVDILGAANMLRYYAGAADKIHGETLKLSREYQGYTLKEPIGVVGLIIPWNVPTTMFFLKVSPALTAECTMRVKKLFINVYGVAISIFYSFCYIFV